GTRPTQRRRCGGSTESSTRDGSATAAASSHTTPSSPPCRGFLTITHPGHPLCGQRVEVIRSGPGVDPDLVVRRADGRHLPIARSSTDADPQDSDDPAPRPDHLLDLEALRRLIPVLDRMDRAASAMAEHNIRLRAVPPEER